MRKLRNHLVGIDQGDNVLFSDYETGGEMWTGSGTRERRKRVKFTEKYRQPPAVFCALSMWDMGNSSNARADVTAERISAEGFDIVFRTWSDTKIARARVRWMAFGELPQEDEWELY